MNTPVRYFSMQNTPFADVVTVSNVVFNMFKRVTYPLSNMLTLYTYQRIFGTWNGTIFTVVGLYGNIVLPGTFYNFYCCQGRSQPRSPGWARFLLSSFFLKFPSFFLIFPKIFLIFVLILALRVGEPPGKSLATPLTVVPFSQCHHFVPFPLQCHRFALVPLQCQRHYFAVALASCQCHQ